MQTFDPESDAAIEAALRGLIRRANARRRVQRLVDVGCAAALPALVLAAMAILVAKHGFMAEGTLSGALGALGALVVGMGLLAALWPIPPLRTLMRLDTGNAFSDRLSSAWAFLQVPAESRTPEQWLHLRRTMELLPGVEPSRAHLFHRPPDGAPALVLVAVVAFTGLLQEPSPDPLPAVAPMEAPAPRFILDLASLRQEIRQVEELAELAEQSEDPALQAIADDLESIVDRAQRGVLDEETLLDELASIEERLAALDVEPPPDLSEEWHEVAERLREMLEEPDDAGALDEVLEALPPEARERVDELIEAIEEGDEEAIADGLGLLESLLESDDLDLSEENLEALADMLERFADAFDPADLDLRRELDALRDRVADRESEAGDDGGRRSRRALERAREQLADAEQALAEAMNGLDEGGETRRDVAEALREAAESLREPEASQASEAEPSNEQPEPGAEPAERDRDAVAEREAQAGQEADEQRDAGRPGQLGDDSTEAEGESERTARADSGELAEPGAEPSEGEPGDRPRGESEPRVSEAQQRVGGEAGEQPGDPEAQASGAPPSQGEPGADPAQAGAEPTSTPPESPRDQAANGVEEAAERLRERQRQQATAEGRERAEQATEGMRENLQRNSADPQEGQRDEMAESVWDDFMDRAGGQPSQTSGSAAGEPGAGPEPPGESTPEGETQAGGYGDEAGSDALGERSTELDGERERVEAEVEVGDDGEAGRPTSEVVESVAVEGFATRGYVEVYREYAESVEEALRRGEVPLGYARFVERYFSLIEPRDE